MKFVIFPAQWEEMCHFKLPIQLRGSKEPSVDEFISKIESLTVERKAFCLIKNCAADDPLAAAT